MRSKIKFVICILILLANYIPGFSENPDMNIEISTNVQNINTGKIRAFVIKEGSNEEGVRFWIEAFEGPSIIGNHVNESSFTYTINNNDLLFKSNMESEVEEIELVEFFELEPDVYFAVLESNMPSYLNVSEYQYEAKVSINANSSGINLGLVKLSLIEELQKIYYSGSSELNGRMIIVDTNVTISTDVENDYLFYFQFLISID